MVTIEIPPASVKKAGSKTWTIIKKRPKTFIAIGILLFLILGGVALAMRPNEPEYITEAAIRGDLVQSVEAVGEVISERDLKLQFPLTGVVERVYVTEGDSVKAGQELAMLRSSGLSADVNSAAASVASAKAELDKLLEGTREEELAIARISVDNKQASLESAKQSLLTAERNYVESQNKLESLKREVQASLQGFAGTAQAAIAQQLSSAQIALRSLEDTLRSNILLDSIVRYEPGAYKLSQNRLNTAANSLETAKIKYRNITDYQDAINSLTSAQFTVSRTAGAIDDLYINVSSLPITSVFTVTQREAVKATIASQKSAVLAAASSLESTKKTIVDAAAGFETRIANEEASLVNSLGSKEKALSDIQTFTTTLAIEQANLSLKKAGTRQADIDAARARLNQSYAQLQRARERYQDTIIRAPIDGKITQVNLKEGELLSTSFESSAAIAMLGNAPYRIEMFISEIDIPLVRLGQSGSIVLDAFPNQEFDLVVTELDPAGTIVDGVSKYKAKLDFSDPEIQEGMKIGMTGDARIITDSRESVIMIPARAEYTTKEGKNVVKILDPELGSTEQEVRLGISGEDGLAEVISGVSEGDVIIVLEKK